MVFIDESLVNLLKEVVAHFLCDVASGHSTSAYCCKVGFLRPYQPLHTIINGWGWLSGASSAIREGKTPQEELISARKMAWTSLHANSLAQKETNQRISMEGSSEYNMMLWVIKSWEEQWHKRGEMDRSRQPARKLAVWRVLAWCTEREKSGAMLVYIRALILNMIEKVTTSALLFLRKCGFIEFDALSGPLDATFLVTQSTFDHFMGEETTLYTREVDEYKVHCGVSEWGRGRDGYSLLASCIFQQECWCQFLVARRHVAVSTTMRQISMWWGF